jgi:hypothetical protein
MKIHISRELDNLMGTKFIDLTGQRFGKLLVIKRGPNKTKHSKWICKCNCGNEVNVFGFSLKSGGSLSCGCNSRKITSNHPHWTGYGPISGCYWGRLLGSAKVRNIQVEITIQDALKLFYHQDRKCKLSGLDIQFSIDDKTRVSYQTASLDRIDSNLGYTVDNVQWLHKSVQLMKNALLQEEFVYFCQRIADHSRKSQVAQPSESPPERATPKLRLVKKES